MKGRRDNGNGTITLRSDGAWAVAISLGTDLDGNRIRKQATCKTKKDAQNKLKEWQSSKEQLVDLTKDGMTVGTLIDVW